MASIECLLSDLPCSDVKALIISQLWGADVQTLPESYKSYLRYYGTECRRLQFGISKEAWQSTSMAASTHKHMIMIVNTLALDKNCNRPAVRALLRQHFPNSHELALDRSIDFALRAWLTMNVREESFALHTPRTPTIQWDDTSTLADFVIRNFPLTTTTSSYPLDHTFTVANINRLSGIDIEWTPCLADHLRFDKRRRLLRVYPFKQTLLDHIQIWQSSKTAPENASRALIPITVLKETLLSLDLLFPYWDPLTDSFMRQHDQTFHLDGPFNDSGPLTLIDFDHWRNRLLELHHMFHSPPVGWSQIWADRRNPLQWYTFWLAIVILVLTLIFGIISSVTSIMQTCLAYESIKIARSQQNLG